ncbi:MAG: hypothetical protein AAGE80_04550 [Pseudomonadota bacterium]
MALSIQQFLGFWNRLQIYIETEGCRIINDNFKTVSCSDRSSGSEIAPSRPISHCRP